MSDSEAPVPNPAESGQQIPPGIPPEAPAELQDKNDIVGIMAAHSSWVVPGWIKAATFWVSLVAIGGMVVTQLDKHATFLRLLVDGVVEPEGWGDRAAPDFSLKKGPDGGELALSSMKGSWVLVNFWATWCPPCRDEMPSLEMLARRLTRDHPKQIQILAVTVDEDWNEVNRFFGATAPSFPVLWDRDKRAAGSYSSTRFPETFLVNPEGKVVAKFTGPRDWYNQGMVQYFDEVLRGKRKPVS